MVRLAVPITKDGKTTWVRPGTEGTKEGSFVSNAYSTKIKRYK